MRQKDMILRDADGRPGQAAARPPAPPAPRNRALRPILMGGGVILVAVVALVYWLFGGGTVETNDSYVDAAKVSLSTDVSGLVGEVDVHDNQHVSKGQTLFTLSQTQFNLAVDAARAQLAEAAQDIEAGKRAYAQDQAQIAAQQALVDKDKADLARFAAVVATGGATRSQYDDARFTLIGDQARLGQMQAGAGQQLVRLSGDADIDPTKTPEYLNAQAALDRALTDQRDSIVRAPFSGYVTGVESLQPGMYLAAGTAAFGLVSDQDVFVTAQPKEDQLTWVRPGQKVEVSVDTYPGQVWRGEVESLSDASGSEFSVLPAQNSSGNWVKVVQRIPVRIKILSGPADMPLRAGMSTEIAIDTGHSRHLSDLF